MLVSLSEEIPNWILLGAFLTYLAVLLYTVYRIIMDTQSAAKTLGYLLLLILLPILGIVIYYSFGVDTRHGKSNRELAQQYRVVSKDFMDYLYDPSEDGDPSYPEELGHFTEMVRLVKSLGYERLTANTFHLLSNGEEKFPEVLKSLEAAAKYIHMEYYAWENDVRGNQIKDVLIRKAREGIAVRVLYDDFASRVIRNNIARELTEAGVQIYPIIKVRIHKLANRLNHRDHRKVIVIDGNTGFIGGINISDRYDNSIDTGLYWRDTHVRITGPGVMNLQRHFAVNWNFCQPEQIALPDSVPSDGKTTDPSAIRAHSQILAGGPFYRQPNIMLAYSRLFTLAKQRLYITNPYFIPNDTIMDALKKAALSGVDVRLLLPAKSDSALVGAAARFYFRDLLQTGVKIYLYKKGFVHAKTAVADGYASVVGTANMDIRSFDLNFEIMSLIYGSQFAGQMERAFLEDLRDSDQIDLSEWLAQGRLKFLTYAIARLVSSFL
jgi:cardiolipin synthase